MLLALLRGGLFLAGFLGAGAMAWAGRAYFAEDDLPEFVLEHLPLASGLSEDLWLGALRVHVVAGCLALPACLILLSRRVLGAWPLLHRWLGRLTGVVIMLALLPSGAVLSLDAKEGWPVSVGFWLSGSVVACGMVLGVRAARRRQSVAHRRWVSHVAGQLAVAVASRVLMAALDAAAVDPGVAYLAALWIPVVLSVVIIEFLNRPRALPVRRTRRRTHENAMAGVVAAHPAVSSGAGG